MDMRSNISPGAGATATLDADGKILSREEASPKLLTPAARRALEEARARRAEIDRIVNQRPKELRGRDGPDPVRYGDWENKGIVSDF